MEISIGVLAACLPPLGPLIRRVPSPGKLYGSIKDNLGLHSSRTESTKETPRIAHTSDGGWINLVDRKRSGGHSSDAIDIHVESQGSRQYSDV